MRASLTTFANWPELLGKLQAHCNDETHLAVLGGQISSSHWRSPAIVEGLYAASQALNLPQYLNLVGEAAMSQARRLVESGDQKVQKGIYDSLAENLRGEDVLQLVTRRIQEASKVHIDSELWASTVRKFSFHYRWCILKTWLGAWATSHRLHEEDGVRCCVFGCTKAADSWHHYIGSPCAWLPSFLAHGIGYISGLEERIQFLCYTDLGCKVVAVAFQTYHKLRAKARSGKLELCAEPNLALNMALMLKNLREE